RLARDGLDRHGVEAALVDDRLRRVEQLLPPLGAAHPLRCLLCADAHVTFGYGSVTYIGVSSVDGSVMESAAATRNVGPGPELPDEVEVAIVGAGFSGLGVAIRLLQE